MRKNARGLDAKEMKLHKSCNVCGNSRFSITGVLNRSGIIVSPSLFLFISTAIQSALDEIKEMYSERLIYNPHLTRYVSTRVPQFNIEKKPGSDIVSACSINTEIS
jgi:hypothetical protein